MANNKSKKDTACNDNQILSIQNTPRKISLGYTSGIAGTVLNRRKHIVYLNHLTEWYRPNPATLARPGLYIHPARQSPGQQQHPHPQTPDGKHRARAWSRPSNNLPSPW